MLAGPALGSELRWCATVAMSEVEPRSEYRGGLRGNNSSCYAAIIGTAAIAANMPTTLQRVMRSFNTSHARPTVTAG